MTSSGGRIDRWSYVRRARMRLSRFGLQDGRRPILGGLINQHETAARNRCTPANVVNGPTPG
jgi:hypothetical protein